MRRTSDNPKARWRKVVPALIGVGGIVLFSSPILGSAASGPAIARSLAPAVPTPTTEASSAGGVTKTTKPLPFPGGKLPVGVRRARDVLATPASGPLQMSTLSSATLEAAKNDDAAFVDSVGLFYVDEFEGGSDGKVLASGVEAASTESTTGPLSPTGPEQASPIQPSDLANTFLLHSRPGSAKTIYLHFGGGTLSGTAWNRDFVGGGGSVVLAPYDTDGTPATFGTTERNTIQQAFRSVAEDFALFDVDVTTEPPSGDKITRSSNSDTVYGTYVVITPTKIGCTSCSGIAYVNIFGNVGDFLKPALVYPDGTYAGEDIANVISHEVGHNFGLSHDGDANGQYSPGFAPWMPIMGGGRYASSRPYSQWSKGEYPGATQFQDDLAIIALNAPTLPDDFGSTTGTATPVTTPGLRVFNGQISDGSDFDVFRLDLPTGGGVTVGLDVMDYGRNLIPTMALLDATGGVVKGGTYVYPAGTSLRSVSLAPGTYYLAVTGGPRYYGYVGGGGFTVPTYGNVGRYSLSIETAPLPAVPSGIFGSARFAGYQLNWTAVPADSVEIELCPATGACSTQTVPSSNGLVQFSGLVQGDTYAYRLRGTSVWGTSAWAPSGSFVAGGYGPLGTGITASAAAHTFSWGATNFLGGYSVWPRGVEVRVRDASVNGAWSLYSTGQSAYSVLSPIAGHVYQFQVRSVEGSNVGLWSDIREAIVGREAATAGVSSTPPVPTTRPPSAASNSVTSTGRTAAPGAVGVRATA